MTKEMEQPFVQLPIPNYLPMEKPEFLETEEERKSMLTEVLKDLYLLKQSIEHNASTPEARAASVDKIRDKLKELLKAEE